MPPVTSFPGLPSRLCLVEQSRPLHVRLPQALLLAVSARLSVETCQEE